MPAIPWYGWALMTVVIWGVHYNLIGKATEAVSPLFLFLLPAPFLLLALPLYWHSIVDDWNTLMASSDLVRWSTFICGITGTIGTLMLFQALGTADNPTQVGLIEIMYPIFVALFGYLIFKEQHLNWAMFSGGTLMLIGSALIIWKG